MRVRFVSRNSHKIAEVTDHLGGLGIEVVPALHELHELQTADADALIRDKCLRAHAIVGRPLFVEHTGLHLDAMNGLPGGLTQLFWDRLREDRFCELYGRSPAAGVEARSTAAYCDGRTITTFSHSVRGTITDRPRGPRGFQWDCVFQPEGATETFAEMGAAKRDRSMRAPVLDKVAAHLGAVR